MICVFLGTFPFHSSSRIGGGVGCNIPTSVSDFSDLRFLSYLGEL